ncbi:glycosyltransferase [bacterium]|nr:glycosyltransferase [bacterium]
MMTPPDHQTLPIESDRLPPIPCESTPTHVIPVSAIVLSYNIPTMLMDCVQSLLSQPHIQEILIIENGSTHPDMAATYRTIQTMSDTVTIRVMDATPPLSFSEAHNLGLDECTHEWVLLLNNDARLHGQVLHHAVALMTQHPSVGIVGARILNPDMTVNHLGLIPQPHQIGYEHIGRGLHGMSPYPIELPTLPAVTAACMLVRRCHIRFDPHYWFGLEDIDFCFQYAKEGQQVMLSSSFVAIHPESTTRATLQETNKDWRLKQLHGLHYFKKKWRWRWVMDWLRFFPVFLRVPDHRVVNPAVAVLANWGTALVLLTGAIMVPTVAEYLFITLVMVGVSLLIRTLIGWALTP